MDDRAKGNKKMREADVRGAMMNMMMSGEKPSDMKESLDKVGRESDAEYIRETKGQDTGASKKKRGMKSGGSVKGYKSGGSVSKRADGCVKKGKTKGRMI